MEDRVGDAQAGQADLKGVSRLAFRRGPGGMDLHVNVPGDEAPIGQTGTALQCRGQGAQHVLTIVRRDVQADHRESSARNRPGGAQDRGDRAAGDENQGL